MKTQFLFPVIAILASACSLHEPVSVPKGKDLYASASNEKVVFEDFDALGNLEVTYEYERELPKSTISTRGPKSTGKVLIIGLTDDDGTAQFSTAQANALLQSDLQEFWQWHMPSVVDYSDVVLAVFDMPGSLPVNPAQILSYIEDNVIDPVRELHKLSYEEVRHTIVLLPPGAYGFFAAASSRNGLINTSIPERKLLFTMGHILGHHYGLNHSQQQYYSDCAFASLQPFGGDDIMGGSFFRKLNAFQLDRLGVLDDISVSNLKVGESRTFWIQPVDEDKAALRIEDNFFIYHRKENSRINVLQGAYRRDNRPISDDQIKLVTFRMSLEGVQRKELTPFWIRICADGEVRYDGQINAIGSFTIPLPMASALSIWIDAPRYIATTTQFATAVLPSTVDVLLKCGDMNDDGVVDVADLNSPEDINMDGRIDQADLKLISMNMGLTQEAPECTPYVINGIDYEVVFGQSAMTYRDAGIDPTGLFPEAEGKVTEDAVWVQIKKVLDPCDPTSGYNSTPDIVN